MKKTINIGISGWSYIDWKRIFYPEKMKSFDWLEYYAQSFKVTELNSSFYHLPESKTVLKWIERVPETFKFCPKISKYITHTSRLKNPEESLQRFYETFAPMKKQLGPILIQLPPSLAYDNALATAFFEALGQNSGRYNFALEARHISWIEDGAFELMRKFGIAWVISQSGVGFPYAEEITAKFVYLRFHGPAALYSSSYTADMLAGYSAKIDRWQYDGREVWVFFNNCYNGVAIENANTLKEMLNIE